MPNELANETSPYLRQHQDNPVNWYPWNEAALSKAKQEHKPIFLSIGYAACHWCHVMAHESFESIETAKILNQHFINIKVDREERPDLDNIYMQAVVNLTGQGGWPLSVFLTPDLLPFYGGTYFPPQPRYGMPSFQQVLFSVIDAWENKQPSLRKSAQALTESIKIDQTQIVEGHDLLNLDDLVHKLMNTYDWQNGGWGSAPKFPQPMVIDFLIRRATKGNKQVRDLISHSLETMAQGGLYDLVGGGFHRYSTDAIWLIPHFEKMLYDNALLALVYTHGFSLTGNEFFKSIAVDTLNFIQSEMTHPDGGFYSSLDADTIEGEGRYYAWSLDQLRKNLSSEQFNLLKQTLSISERGNFESGLNVLQFTQRFSKLTESLNIFSSELISNLKSIFSELKDIRSKRPAPLKDDKIITAWNALAIRAFAQAGLLLNHLDFIQTAKKAMNFMLNNIQKDHGKLNRTWCQGRASQPGTLEDYASLIVALYSLYEVDFDPFYYQQMQTFIETAKELFFASNKLFYDSASDVPNMIFRPQNLQDNATPSGNALIAHALWILANLDENSSGFEKASKMMSAVQSNIMRFPTAFGYWLQIADLIIEPSQQVALVSDQPLNSLQPFLSIYRGRIRPNSIIAANYSGISGKLPILLENRQSLEEKPTAYMCRNFTCNLPATEPEHFKSELDHQV